MEETNIEEIQTTAIALYVAMETLNKLHEAMEMEGNDGMVEGCAHCSALADGIIAYPCPTVQVLLTDFISGTSEPAESEEPSS